MGLRYALGVPPFLRVWLPRARASRAVEAVAARLPRHRWRRVCWGQGTKGPLAARFVALRVRPAKSSRDCWLLCERPLSGKDDPKYYFIQAPATMALKALVTLAHTRWKIEQHYHELKGELGLDHFEGRSWRGWHHHAVLAALTYTFLQLERRRGTQPLPTFPAIRNLVRELVAMLFFITRPKWLDLLARFQRDPPLRI
ncbi:MAG: transposase [Luteitalea sp.]|nr:transposase [Luteitalea sp.]